MAYNVISCKKIQKKLKKSKSPISLQSCPKGVCSPMYSHYLTFYGPSHYLFSFPSNGPQRKKIPFFTDFLFLSAKKCCGFGYVQSENIRKVVPVFWSFLGFFVIGGRLRSILGLFSSFRALCPMGWDGMDGWMGLDGDHRSQVVYSTFGANNVIFIKPHDTDFLSFCHFIFLSLGRCQKKTDLFGTLSETSDSPTHRARLGQSPKKNVFFQSLGP